MNSILIFGGAGGIGLAVARTAEKLGFSVVVADKRSPQIKSLDHFPCDATEELDVKRAFLYVLEKFGSIDAVVNAQGVYEVNPIEKTELAAWEKMIAVNLKSVFLVCRAAAFHMKWQKRGYIVNIASMAGLRGKAGEGAYCASKFGVVGLTDALFEELRGTGVRVTAICPASVDTPLLRRAVKLSKEDMENVLKPEDIARVIAELITSHKRVYRKIVALELGSDVSKLGKEK